MAKLRTGMVAMASCVAIGGPAVAQVGAPLAGQEVVGAWVLRVTPAERRDLEIDIQVEDGDLPLTIIPRAGGRIACVLRGDPAPCRIDRGRLVITMPTSSGAARLTFTLAERTRDGFRGEARLSLRFLPVGGHIGAVTMGPR